MAPARLGLVLDSSVLIAAERRNLRPDQAIESAQKVVGEIAIVLSAVTVAEIGHGIYRADTPRLRDRRRAFLNELKATVPKHGRDLLGAEFWMVKFNERAGVEEVAHRLSESLLALRDDRLRPRTGVHCRHSADLLVSGDVVRSCNFFARLFQKTLIDQGRQGID